MKKYFNILLIGLLGVYLSGCAVHLGMLDYTYSNSDRYSAGDARFTTRDGIKNLNIDWVAGDIEISTKRGYEIEVYEVSRRGNLPRSLSMHYWLDGSTLRIKYCRSGTNDYDNLSKTLYVVLPENYKFSDVKINSVSAGIKCSDLVTDDFDVNSVSGRIDIKPYTDVRKKCNIDSVSGSVYIDLGVTEELKVGTVSGSVYVVCDDVSKADIDTTSGYVKIEYRNYPPYELEIDTMSGGVEVVIPEDSEFEAKLKSMSGSIDIDRCFRTRKVNDTWTCGMTGDTYIDINTMSGSITITGNY